MRDEELWFKSPRDLFSLDDCDSMAPSLLIQSKEIRQDFHLNSSFIIQSIFSTAMNASLGTATLPTWRMRFLPSFCFSSSFFLRVISPP